MKLARAGDDILVRLDLGEDLLESLKEVARRESLPSASFTALGAVSEVTLALFDPAERVYRTTRFAEPLEIAAVVGNVAWLEEGEPAVHAHGVFSREDCSAVAGHVMSAVISVTGEVMMRAGGHKVIRRHDPRSGLNLLSLP